MKILLLLLLTVIIIPQKVYAASVQLQNGKTALDHVEEYLVDAIITIQAPDNTVYYLRGVFAKQGSSNYCGYTWNGSSWYSGPYSTNEGWKNFLPIIIQNNTWSGQIKARIDLEDSGCNASGNYTFKVERFTPSGSGTFDTQNEQIVLINIPSPTSTFTPTPKPSPTSKPTPTTKPTATSFPLKNTPTLTQSPTAVVPTKLSSITPQVTSISSVSAMVLGASISATPTLVLVKTDTEHKSNFPLTSLFMICGGVMLILACGILGFNTWKKKGINNET